MTPVKHIIDAHTLLWHLCDDPRLSATAQAILEDPDSELILPVIALAEACWAVERGRVPVSVEAILTALDTHLFATVVPLDRSIVERSLGLTAVTEMHDRQIVATALVLADAGDSVVVLTRDPVITACGLVPITW